MKYDVIVVGGGTAGVSCAYNSAKLGLKTLIIEQNSFLGGSITSSLVIPAMKTGNNAINTDFYDILYDKLHELGGAITYCDGNKGWFNPELTKIALDILMKEVDADVLYETKVIDIKKDNNKILSVCIDTIDDNNITYSDKVLLEPIGTNHLVDATGNARIFQKLNCEFLENSCDEVQPMNLRFIMSDVDIKKFSNWLTKYDMDRNTTTCCLTEGNIYVSTAYTWDKNKKWALKPLFERAIADGVITNDDSNYFQLFSVAGTSDSIAFNAPRLLDNSLSRSEAYKQGRLSILRLSNFCKRFLPGFKAAYISSIANTLGVRVSNRIKGKYIYTYDDLVSGKKFDTPVLKSNYPVDVHSCMQGHSILEHVLQDYELPIESLMSNTYKNLYAIGRCISAEFKAQAALRIIPSCFSMGEGLAKYLAKN